MCINRYRRAHTRLMLSYRDAEEAETMFRQAQSAHAEDRQIEARALITAGIIAYARPFSGNSNHPDAAPTPPFSRRQLTQEEAALHDQVLQLRNKAVAHTDLEYNAVEIAAYVSNGFVFSASQYQPLDEVSRLGALEQLARIAKDQFAHGAFEAARNIEAATRGAG